MFESLALQELHRDDGLPIAFINVVNRADVRMVQRRRGVRFALKTLQSLAALREFLRQELQGDKPVEFGVLRFVDHAHPAPAEFLENAVMRDGLAEHGATVRGNVTAYHKLLKLSSILTLAFSRTEPPDYSRKTPHFSRIHLAVKSACRTVTPQISLRPICFGCRPELPNLSPIL